MMLRTSGSTVSLASVNTHRVDDAEDERIDGLAGQHELVEDVLMLVQHLAQAEQRVVTHILVLLADSAQQLQHVRLDARSAAKKHVNQRVV